MNRRLYSAACTMMAAIAIVTTTYKVRTSAATVEPQLAAFTFDREGAASPDAAAIALLRGCALRSPKDFVRHLLLGVCDGPIGTLQKFAECLHVTQFSHGEETFTVYELPKQINHDRPIRVIAKMDFDPDDKRVEALSTQMMSTYYGQAFMCVDVAAEGYDRRQYQSRVVVAQLGDQWFAIPRCRSAISFYEIADSMELTPQTD
ncbi:MAG: hypothetical protein WBD31_13005 [Rubripirellula sp.]